MLVFSPSGGKDNSAQTRLSVKDAEGGLPGLPVMGWSKDAAETHLVHRLNNEQRWRPLLLPTSLLERSIRHVVF